MNPELQAWHIRSVHGMKTEHRVPVASVDEAVSVLRDLAQQDLANDAVDWNAQGLEVLRNGEWEEWESEDGETIDELKA